MLSKIINNYSILAVIPARSGSKGIPNKNIKRLGGKYLFEYSIDYAKDCSNVDFIYVSTDSKKYAEIAQNLGAEAYPLRPKKFANDHSRDFDFLKHAMEVYECKSIVFDYYAILRPTSPLRPKKLIERAKSIMDSNTSITSVRTVKKSSEHPYRSWKLNNDGSMGQIVENNVIEPYNWPRQELPITYFQTGDLELVSRNCILSGSVSGSNVYPLVISEDDMLDIDKEEDFKKAANVIS